MTAWLLYLSPDTNEFGYNPDNRFIYDEATGMYMDDSALCGGNRGGPNTYILTEVRPNDGDTSGTISQPAKRRFWFYINSYLVRSLLKIQLIQVCFNIKLYNNLPGVFPYSNIQL